ncbi:MAG: DNA topoisomerase VI subunit B [Planctomycetota bacterium]
MVLDRRPRHARAAHTKEGVPLAKSGSARRATAETMAAKQREISVSEFFAKNRHLLGFDNPRKALLTAVKEAVDNALDACEEGGILPDIAVELRHLPKIAEDRFLVIVHDNGPGIVRKQIESIFGKLLYGSKFHRLKMSRGQQGIGISAAGMYGLITTGKPVKIISKTAHNKPAHEVVLKMDTSKNRADVVSDTERPEDDALFPDGHGTRVEIEMQGKYLKGDRSVDQYVQLSAIANPHARFAYVSPPTAAEPTGARVVFERSVHELPEQPEEIKPHPHGVELGTLIGMLERTDENQLGGFFSREFCRVGPKVAQSVAEKAGLTTRTWVSKIDHAGAEKLYKGLQDARVMGPPTNCLSPIGVKTMLKGLESGLAPDFITASSRPPAVYRGRPFIIEVGLAFGGNIGADQAARVYRFANRVPLQYQQSACASFKSVLDVNWRQYGIEQPRGSLPVGSLVIMVHMASVWVPFTSESKEAIADYDDIRAEMLLALKDCGRKLRAYVNRRKRMKMQGERRGVFQRYIGVIAESCAALTDVDADALYQALLATAESKTAEHDDELDEEGRVVKPTDRLDRDESVYIRDDDVPATVEPKTGPSVGDDDDAPTGDTLFGDDDAHAAANRQKKKVVRKKTKKKVRKRAAR